MLARHVCLCKENPRVDVLIELEPCDLDRRARIEKLFLLVF